MGCEALRVHQIPPGRSGPTPPKRRDAVQSRGGVPGSRFTAGAVPGLSHPASGSIPAASTILWKVRSAWCRHRSRKPGGAQASGFDSCTFRSWKTISRWRERRLLNGWTLTGCGSTPPASAQSIKFRTLHRSEPTRPPVHPGTSPSSWPCEGHRARCTRACTFRFRAPRRRSPTRKTSGSTPDRSTPWTERRRTALLYTKKLLAASTLGRTSPFRRVPPSRAHTHLDSSLVEHQLMELSVAGSNPAPTHDAPLTRTRQLFSRPAGQAPHARETRVRIPPRADSPCGPVAGHSTVNGHRGLSTRARNLLRGGPP